MYLHSPWFKVQWQTNKQHGLKTRAKTIAGLAFNKQGELVIFHSQGILCVNYVGKDSCLNGIQGHEPSDWNPDMGKRSRPGIVRWCMMYARNPPDYL